MISINIIKINNFIYIIVIFQIRIEVKIFMIMLVLFHISTLMMLFTILDDYYQGESKTSVLEIIGNTDNRK